MMRSRLILVVLFVTGAMFVKIDDNTVYINQFEGVLSVTDTEPVVSLPCNYTSAVKGYPIIRWFRQEEGSKRVIAEIDKDNHLVPYGEFTDRVGRGDKGGLLIFEPTVNDSGLYICYLDITGTGSHYERGPVRLNVTHISGVLHPPIAGNVDRTTWKVAPLILVILGWLLAVTCGAFMTFEYMTAASLHAHIKRTQHRDSIRHVVIFRVHVILLMLSVGSLVVSTVFTVNPMMIPEYASNVALSTAIIALVIMAVFVAIPFFVFMKNFKSRAAQSKAEKSMGDTDTDEEQIADEEMLGDVKDSQLELDGRNCTAAYKKTP